MYQTEKMFPEAVALNSYIPVMRRLIARRLKKRGVSQTEIARMLGITQAAVSKILRSQSSEANIQTRGLDIGSVELRLVAEKAADLLYEKNINEAGILVNRYWWLIAASGDACRAHERYGWRKSECYICTKLAYPDLDVSRGLTIADLERALLILSCSKNFHLLIPEVRSNFAVAIPGARNIYDVAAVPGRISKTRDGEILYKRPAFGASRHLASILLSIGGRYRALINIKFDHAVKRVLEDLGVAYGEFSSAEDGGSVAAMVYRVLEECPGCRVVIDRGGRGVEPATYIFGERAVKTAELVVDMAEIYSVLVT